MRRVRALLVVVLCAMWIGIAASGAWACCPSGSEGRPVVNADQTVILIWDAAKRTQHFIRRANFKSEGKDFAFIVPSPSEPQLEEAGDAAFEKLKVMTAPEVVKKTRTKGLMLGDTPAAPAAAAKVKVLQDKEVAGFRAKVLAATSAKALADWLKENGYAFTPEVEAWAAPYVDLQWKFTVMKVAKDKGAKTSDVAAAALRMSFKTDRPLFPYREPDYKGTAAKLGAADRVLRIFFIAEARYEGSFSKTQAWTGKTAWSGKIGKADRKALLEQLKLPGDTGPAEWWLTEFEDRWPYKPAPADVTFAKAEDQSPVKREPITVYSRGPAGVEDELALASSE